MDLLSKRAKIGGPCGLGSEESMPDIFVYVMSILDIIVAIAKY